VAERDPAAVARQYRAHVSRSLAMMLGRRVEMRAEGPYVYDGEGRDYLDCGGFAVFLLGHRHPAVTAAVIEQIERQPLPSRMMLSPPLADASEALAAVAPEGLECVGFTNSGAEATELAIKLARLAGCREVISADGGFHGMTLGAISLIGNDLHAERLGPLLPGVSRVPYGDTAALADALGRSGERACVVLEPVQGEGGVVVPPPGYLRDVRRLCDEHGALMVLDEIQTGLGRTGILWEADREAVVPDMLLTGKALSGGVVGVAAVVATRELYEPLTREPLLHGSTFAGAPIQAAAALAALQVIEREQVPERAARLGEEISTALHDLARGPGSELIADVRGPGLLIGIELASEPLAGRFLLELFDRGVIAKVCSFQTRVVRLTPSAYLGPHDVERLVEAVGAALAAVRDAAPDGRDAREGRAAHPSASAVS
jgi:putrescine aminotransferase